MSEYISKEEINRVLLNRIDMNNKCLSGARESKHFEEEKYFSTLIFEDEQIASLIEKLPSADILEHAREIKDYCEGFPNCEGCRFYKGLPFRCTFGMCPQKWNLPKREKGKT